MQEFLSNPIVIGIMILSGVSGVLFLVTLTSLFFRKRPSFPFPTPLSPSAPFVGGGDESPCAPGAPPSLACIQSQNDAQNKRNAVLALCNTIRALRTLRDTYILIAGAFYVLFAALLGAAIAAAASIFGIFLAVGLFAGAAFALFVAIGFTIQAINLNVRLSDAEFALTNAINDFNAAAAVVRTQCCPDTIKVNLDTPTCASM